MCFKESKDVLYYDLDSNRTDVVNSIIEQYALNHLGQLLEPKDLVAIFGEDLKEKRKKEKEMEIGEMLV